jgi:small subunit ribosomal protein S16
VAVKIKLMRMGKIRAPYYRIVVADARTKRDGRAIEEIGKYHPTEDPSLIEVNSERVQYWLGVGAQPTEPVAAILKVTGDWQKFKGLPGAEGTLRVAAAKTDKKTVFEAAAKESLAEPKAGATTPRKKALAKKAEAPAEAAAEAPAAEAPAAEAPAAETPIAAEGAAATTPDVAAATTPDVAAATTPDVAPATTPDVAPATTPDVAPATEAGTSDESKA